MKRGRYDAISEDMCHAQMTNFTDRYDVFNKSGGVKGMGEAMRREMALGASVGDDPPNLIGRVAAALCALLVWLLPSVPCLCRCCPLCPACVLTRRTPGSNRAPQSSPCGTTTRWA